MGYKTKRELAKALDISPSDLTNRTGSGTIRKLLIDLAIHNNVNIDWILTGQGNMMTGHCSPVAESLADYTAPHRISPENSYADRLVKKAIFVLNSDSEFRDLLASNIKIFYDAVTAEERLAYCEHCIDEMKLEIESLKGAQAKKAV